MNRGMPAKIKAKNFRKSFKKLFFYLKEGRLFIFIAIIFSIVGSVCAVISPKKIGDMINFAYEDILRGNSINLQRINQTGFLLIALYLGSILFSYFSGFLITGVTQKIGKKFRSNIIEKINRLPLSYFDSKAHGDILSRVTNDVDVVVENFNQALSIMISSSVTLIGIIVMMLSISLQMTGVVFATIPISVIFMAIIIKLSQKYFKQQQMTLGMLNGHIEEAYSGHMIIKAFNQEEKSLEKFSKYNEELMTSLWKSSFISGLMMPVVFFVGNLCYIVICMLGGLLAVNQNNLVVDLNFFKAFFTDYKFISTSVVMLGTIQSFIMYTRQFNPQLQQFAQISNVLQSCAAAFERVIEFLDEEEQVKETPKNSIDKSNVEGYVEFSNVNFGYSSDKQIIFDFNAKIKPGQKVAIVGPTGAGKTTLVNLLMRFYEINSGSIKIDGIDTSTISRENTRALFGMVLQDTWLFEGTILENLKYANKDVSFEDVTNACKACHIDHFILSLSDGYNHYIDENASISQGQKQLITIARAMIENAPMLILDEATSSVDTRTEVLIQKAMDKLMKGRTSFVIAHRLSTIKNADIILVMNNGNIVESGSHEELMKLNGFYTGLYNSQFSNE